MFTVNPFFSGCSDDSDPTGPNGNGDGITVTVTPNSLELLLGNTQQFNAEVSGTTDTRVNWEVEGGSDWGTITETGFYSTPEDLPDPATATVRATSVADSSKNGTAIITLLEDTSGSNLTQEERELCVLAFSSGADASALAEDAISLGVQAVWLASEINGGMATFTGTLTQTAPGSNYWVYSSSPSDRLVLAYSGVPQVEFTFTIFDGYTEGTYEDFLYQHNLDFSVYQADLIDARIQSQKDYVRKNHPGFLDTQEWNSEYSGYINGTVVYEGEMVDLVLNMSGDEYGYLESPFLWLEYDEFYTGSANSGRISMSIDERMHSILSHNSDAGEHVRNKQLWSNTTATLEGVSYAYQNVGVAWAWATDLYDSTGSGVYNVVIDDNYWEASGTMFRGGVLWGQVMFDGPVIEGTHGPELILRTEEEDIILHTLIQFP